MLRQSGKSLQGRAAEWIGTLCTDPHAVVHVELHCWLPVHHLLLGGCGNDCWENETCADKSGRD